MKIELPSGSSMLLIAPTLFWTSLTSMPTPSIMTCTHVHPYLGTLRASIHALTCVYISCHLTAGLKLSVTRRAHLYPVGAPRYARRKSCQGAAVITSTPLFRVRLICMPDLDHAFHLHRSSLLTTLKGKSHPPCSSMCRRWSQSVPV